MKHSGLFFIFKFLPSLLVIVLLAVFSSVKAQDVPKDFEVTLASAPNHALRQIEVGSVTITADGRAEFSEWIKPDETRLPETTVQLSQEDVQSIYEVIREQNFFDLESEYNDPNATGGDYALLRITANGETHEVVSRNVRLWPFDLIAIRINRILPEEREIMYNSLWGAPLKEVE